VSSRKRICPGDLVFNFNVNPDIGYSMRDGLVVAVLHPREGAHMGCEERVSVLWSRTLRITLECDCGLQLSTEPPWDRAGTTCQAHEEKSDAE
jgi:hypothetical protein